MHVSSLTLTHFRNYAQEEVHPSSGANLLLGDNAQGKSNLLEALYCLSTTRSYRTTVDRQLINRAFLDEPIPYARITARLEGAAVQTLEMVIAIERENGSAHTRKHCRADGSERRLLDAIGILPTVLFTPDDIALVSGPPELRRRFLDILLCQAHRDYCRALSLYNRALVQRNQLLRLIASRNSDPDTLEYWDGILAESGAVVIQKRRQALADMATVAQSVHYGLAEGEELHMIYRSSADLQTSEATQVEALRQAYHQERSANIERGQTTTGPHRDDVALAIGEMAAGDYGSRGQMRTVALTLRLAEANYLASIFGQMPVLMFDDVMSELDYNRRQALEAAMLDSAQTFVTGLAGDPFSEHFLTAARQYSVQAGKVTEK